jgi:two-component system, OmpR family, phosphate regulon response regulator PhoB
MARILVIEDEDDLASLLEYNLKQDGHELAVARNGAAGLKRFAEFSPDVVLLDLMLPDVSGHEVAKTMKQQRADVSVIMLTARGDEQDRIRGLELGADDYVVKPFSVKELLLRVRNVAKRKTPPVENTHVIKAGRIELDVERHVATVAGTPVTLTALEFKLLKTFMTRLGRMQTREVLLADVWNIEADITTRTVDTHIKRLREKLGEVGDCIETVRGVGYRMQSEP